MTKRDTFFITGHSYIAKHVPTGEDWCILGIDVKGNRVCAAGYPPSIGKLSDCINFELFGSLDEKELAYRKKHFGENWL